jgi:cobalt/nickel transport system permease protein
VIAERGGAFTRLIEFENLRSGWEIKSMHIPDAVLSPQVVGTTSVLAVGGLAIGLRKLQHLLRERTTVLMGTMAAFVFAAQMVNFPLYPLPISGHLLGGVLSAVLLGPWAGAVVIAAVLVVQCFLFGDGGLTALGANFVNMGLIGSVGGYAIYLPIRRMIGGQGGVIFGAMVAAWFSVILASGAFAVELAASGRHGEFLTVLGWMALVHAGIGLGEALITGMVLRFILLTRPDLIYDPKPEPGISSGRWSQVFVGRLAIALAIAIFLAPFASEHDDGLEWVGSKLGFLKEAPPIIQAPIPEYQLAIPGFAHPKLATAIAGLVGTVVVFGVGFGLARGVSRGRPAEIAEDSSREDRSASSR